MKKSGRQKGIKKIRIFWLKIGSGRKKRGKYERLKKANQFNIWYSIMLILFWEYMFLIAKKIHFIFFLKINQVKPEIYAFESTN